MAKFVVSRCAFCKLRRNLGFSCSVNHLSGNTSHVYLHEFKRSWFVIRDWWISIRFVCFVFQGSLLCDRSGNNQLVSLAAYAARLIICNAFYAPAGGGGGGVLPYIGYIGICGAIGYSL